MAIIAVVSVISVISAVEGLRSGRRRGVLAFVEDAHDLEVPALEVGFELVHDVADFGGFTVVSPVEALDEVDEGIFRPILARGD